MLVVMEIASLNSLKRFRINYLELQILISASRLKSIAAHDKMWYVIYRCVSKEHTSSNSFVPAEYCDGYIQTLCFVCIRFTQLRNKMICFSKKAAY